VSDPFGSPIEGATPIDSMEGLRDPSIRTLAQLSLAEAENVRKAVVRYFTGPVITARHAPFDYGWMLALHREMFGDVWEWAGEVRRVEVTIGVDPAQVPAQLGNLAMNVEHFATTPDKLVESAAHLHHQAVWIHPFRNGNGRWSRMLANLWLARHGSPVIEWPEATVGAASDVRSEYVATLRAADNGDLRPLIGLHERFLGAE
jgi:Fic-DOC domain mobile mystery protein B